MLFALRKQAEEASANLPALIVEAQKAVASILQGEHPQRKAGNGEKFWQFREYQPSDRPQDIDWRQSAKTDRVYIRQKEWQTTQTTMFWCAQNESMDFASSKNLPTKAERATIITLALSILLTKAGEQIGMLGSNKRGRSSAMLDHIGNILCDKKETTAALPDFSHAKLPRNASFIQIGDFLEPLEAIEQSFQNFSHDVGNGFVIQVLDPAEIELPFEGRAIFEEPAHQSRETIDHISSIRSEYQIRIQQHMEALETLSKRHGFDYILHRTDQPVSESLALIWARMSNHSEGAR